MQSNFTMSFKKQAVEKALNRTEDTTIKEIADSLRIGCSTLERWITKSRNNEFEIDSLNETLTMTNEKRPQDWSLEERLNMVIACNSLNEEEVGEYCREQGIYLHYIEQWKNDFVNGNTQVSKAESNTELKSLKKENKELKKDLNRKDKALAETAALLILQKKVNTIWGSEEDDSQ